MSETPKYPAPMMETWVTVLEESRLPWEKSPVTVCRATPWPVLV